MQLAQSNNVCSAFYPLLFLPLNQSLTPRHTRNVNIPALNDSKYIGLSIYNVVIFSALGVPLSYLLADNSGYTYAIVGGLIIFCTTLTLCLLFLPKVRIGHDSFNVTFLFTSFYLLHGTWSIFVLKLFSSFLYGSFYSQPIPPSVCNEV